MILTIRFDELKITPEKFGTILIKTKFNFVQMNGKEEAFKIFGLNFQELKNIIKIVKYVK